jgi:heme exporter protein A
MELVVEDLTCARGGMPVIEHVGFRVPAGRALILRGRNGSGKTTLLRTLAGLQPPVSGSVSPSPDAFAYAGHADAVKATLTLGDNLSFWAEIHGSDAVHRAIAAFDLGGLSDRLAQHLSAGQRRRLGLARLAVAGRPVWALDEPTVSLVAASVDRFVAVIRPHLDTGGIAVIATHTDFGIDAEVLEVEQFAARAPVDGFEASFG